MKHTLIALSAVMVASLGAFALGQSHNQLLASHDSAIAALNTKEAAIVAKLNLTSKQRTQYKSLTAKMAAETKAMHAAKSGRIEKGIQINQKLHAGLASIFTPEQYRQYKALWGGAPSEDYGYAALGKAPVVTTQNARVVGQAPAFAKSDDEILQECGASQAQIEKVHNLYQELEVGRMELKALEATGDSDAIWKKASDLNGQFRGGVQKILSPAQYKEYHRIWTEMMGPALARGKGVKVSFVKPGTPPTSTGSKGH
jgi:hypothetical protein